MVYDAFSPILLMQLEALGFCGIGEAKDFVADGNLALDGALPCNTHGGLIGEGYIHGLNLVLEATRQLRGTAVNQVPDARAVLVQLESDRRGARPRLTEREETHMTSVLDGVRVLDLSWGIAGPVAGMLLADHGADVVKIEPPGGDPFRGTPGYDAWLRGRRSIELDLRAAGRPRCLPRARPRRRRGARELRAGHHATARRRRVGTARRQPAARLLLDHAVRNASRRTRRAPATTRWSLPVSASCTSNADTSVARFRT